MRVFQQPAFILHTGAYRETSLLVELYSRNHGRIGLIAKGVRQAKSGLRSLLLPFQPLIVGWSGKGELPVLTAAEHGDMPLRLAGQALYCGFYLNELIMRLLHRHDPHERLFDVYQDTLSSLQNDGAQDAALRIFEKRLLQELGYGLVLDHEVEGREPIDAETLYEYLPERGPIPSNSHSGDEGICLHGRTLKALAIERFSDDLEQREAKALMRGLLARLLNGRPLRSRDLFRQRKTDQADEAG